MKLHLEVAVFMNFISNFTLFYLNTPVQVYMHTEIYAYWNAECNVATNFIILLLI